MDIDSDSIQTFLSSMRKEIEKIIALNNGKEKSIHIVIGNESGDLDSVVAAIVYSFHKQKQAGASCSTLFAPIMNFPEEDMVLKTEVNAIFERLGLELADSLLFKECFLKLLHSNSISEVTLLDHNMLSEDLKYLGNCVTEVIDHHVDTKTFEEPCVAKTIELVGSCCTLVAEKIYNHAEDLFKEFPVAELLLSAILLDTVNLKTGARRTTVKDVEFAEDLESHSKIPQEELFDIAQKAKYNISHLPTRDILRKDFKEVQLDDGTRFGISSITMEAGNLLSRENAVEDIQSFCERNCLGLLLLMFIHCDKEEARRDLVIYSSDQALRETFLRYLLGMEELKLEKAEFSCSLIDFLNQGDPKYSRKLLMPFVMNFFKRKFAQYKGENNNSTVTLQSDTSGMTSLRNNVRATCSGSRKRKSSFDHNEVDQTELRGQSVSPSDERCDEDFSNDWNKKDPSYSKIAEASSPCSESHDANSQSSLEETLPTQPEPSFRAALEEAYTEMDHGIDQPSLEFEENWKSEMYDVKSPGSNDPVSGQKHKIIIHDLSFDDNGPFSELSGIDLLCPVFLAVTEDDEDDDVVLKDIRRKTKSIENLCSALDDDQDFPLRRTKSELPSKYQRKTKKSPGIGKQKWRTSLSEQRKIDRNDSIQEEEQDVVTENPFAGNRDFSDESEARSSVSSSGFDSSPKQYESPSKVVQRFSFSEDEEMDRVDVASCSCTVNDEGEWANQIGCEKHVPGLWDRFVSVSVGGLLRVIDLKLIDPYIKIITHGGIHECRNEKRVVMVFTAAFLPAKYIPKYEIVMEQLFYYAVHTIDLSVQENYDIVYFNSRGSNQPGLDWLKKCYDMVQRRLKKTLNTLYIVHPDFWLKTVLRFYKPFISSKFSRTIKFVKSLHELRRSLSLEYIFIPDEVKRNDPEASYWLIR